MLPSVSSNIDVLLTIYRLKGLVKFYFYFGPGSFEMYLISR